MSWLIHQLPGLGISAITLAAFVLIGNKRPVGWVVGLWSEVCWTAYAIYLRQWGLLISCAAFFVIYWGNWRKWKSDLRLQCGEDVQRARELK